jgi:uncharacterized membrane protein
MFGMMFARLFDQPVALVAVGTMLIVVARLILQNTDATLFLEQAALAISLAGQAMMAFAFFHWFHGDRFSLLSPLPWFALAGLEFILILGIPHYLHRLFSSVILTIALIEGGYLSGFGALMVPLILSATVYLWQNEYRDPQMIFFKQAVGYGLSLGLFWITVSGFSPLGWYLGSRSGISGWFSNPSVAAALNGAVMLYAFYTLTRQEHGIRFSLTGLVFLVTMALLATWMPGLSIAITLLVLGFARGNLRLQGLSIAALLWSVGHFYYTLHTTLLIKSGMLVLTGLILLGIYASLRTHSSEPLLPKDHHAS